MKKTFSEKLGERLRDTTMKSLTGLERRLYAMGIYYSQGAYTSDKYSEYEVNKFRESVNGNTISDKDMASIIRIHKGIKEVEQFIVTNCETGEEKIEKIR